MYHVFTPIISLFLPVFLFMSSISLLPLAADFWTLFHFVRSPCWAGAVDFHHLFTDAPDPEAHAARPSPLVGDARTGVGGTARCSACAGVCALMTYLGVHWYAALLHAVLQSEILHAGCGMV